MGSVLDDHRRPRGIRQVRQRAPAGEVVLEDALLCDNVPHRHLEGRDVGVGDALD